MTSDFTQRQLQLKMGRHPRTDMFLGAQLDLNLDPLHRSEPLPSDLDDDRAQGKFASRLLSSLHSITRK